MDKCLGVFFAWDRNNQLAADRTELLFCDHLKGTEHKTTINETAINKCGRRTLM